MNKDRMFPRCASDIPVREIVDRLTGNIGALCEHLLPNGRREGAEYCCGSVRGEPGKSLGVHLTGAKAGVWKDFATGQGGDLLDLIAATLGLDTADAIGWAKNWLGVDDGAAPGPRPGLTSPAEQKKPGTRNNNLPFALEILRACRPAPGTAVEFYLRARGYMLPVPPVLQYHPSLKYTPTGRSFPAMVASVQRGDGQISAIHRTYLLPGGRGKARVHKPKMALGPIGRGAVRLGPVQPALGLAEGIETALSAMQIFGIPCWAALGAGMAGVEVPKEAIEVQIFGDNGPPGHEAAQKAAEAFKHQGRRVFLRFPPPGFDDWNSFLQSQKSEAIA